ncbi:hypothetical protein LCGC14_2323300 [marine sediment metagenome]|uniref:Uncharacterized protein n=1 Tax=marine sediment metagenome TaxID=412755 RepID=A0A0F9FBX6_9ZZZZ
MVIRILGEPVGPRRFRRRKVHCAICGRHKMFPSFRVEQVKCCNKFVCTYCPRDF